MDIHAATNIPREKSVLTFGLTTIMGVKIEEYRELNL